MALSKETKESVARLLSEEIKNPTGRWPCVMGVVNGARRETDIALSDEIESGRDWTDCV